MDNPVYVLDANVFIEAARRYYAFDLAPGFWGNLVRFASNGQIKSIDRIEGELEKGKDDLAEWTKTDFHQAFDSTSENETLDSYRNIMNWVNNNSQFSDAAKADFANSADGWLVAYAMANGYIVVTHEAINAEIKRKVPIPNICQAFNVQCIDTFAMLRQLSIKFT